MATTIAAAPVTYAAAPVTYAAAPMTYAAAPMTSFGTGTYATTAAPVTYAAAPMTYAAPTTSYATTAAPVSYTTPTTFGTTTMAAPAVSYAAATTYAAPTVSSYAAPATTIAAAPITTYAAPITTYADASPRIATTTTAAAAAAPVTTTYAAPTMHPAPPAVLETVAAPAPITTVMAAPSVTTVAASNYLPATAGSMVVPATTATTNFPTTTSMVAYPGMTQGPFQFYAEGQAPAAAAGTTLRVTICPIKEDSENAMTKFLNGKEVAAGIAGLSGLKLGEAFFADSKLVVIAKYDNMENLETGSAVNAKLLGQVAENLAGAPTRYSGEARWSYKGRGSSTDEVANRITILPIKPGSEAAIDELTKIIELKLDDKTFDEVIDITSFYSEGKKLVIVARYSNMKALEAASEKAAALMKDMAQFAAGAPDRFSGSLAWTAAADAPKKKKKAKKAKKGCC